VGKGDKHRRLPLNSEARNALEAIQSQPAEQASSAVFHAASAGRTQHLAHRGSLARP
jgi:site-specific recombinase XerC